MSLLSRSRIFNAVIFLLLLLTFNTAYSQQTQDSIPRKDSSIYKDPKPGYYPTVFKWASVVFKPNSLKFRNGLFKKDYRAFQNFIEDWVHVQARKTDSFEVSYSYNILYYKNGNCDIKIDIYLKALNHKLVKLDGAPGAFNGMFVPYWFFLEGPVTPPRCPPNTGIIRYHSIESQECFAEPM